MSTFKIGGSPLQPAAGVSNGKKVEKKTERQDAAPTKGGFDRTSINRNPLAVMPRMSTFGGQDAKQVQSAAVETLLRDSAKELDDYFTKAYGFDVEA